MIITTTEDGKRSKNYSTIYVEIHPKYYVSISNMAMTKIKFAKETTIEVLFVAVFEYQHKNLNLPGHGYQKVQEKLAMKAQAKKLKQSFVDV